MTTPFISANQLRKNGQFAEALAMYETHWSDETLPRYEWDTWSYAFCLKKANRYAELLDFCRKAYTSYPSFEALNTLYAWAIYYTTVRAEGVKEADLSKAAKGIIRLTTQSNVYAPYTLAVMKVMEVLAQKNKFPAKEILEWSALLDVSLLDTTPSSFVDKRGKTVALASKCEQFFGFRLKALCLDEQHEACIATSAQALSFLPKLHYGNEHWFRRYAALSYSKMGDFAQALSLLQTIFSRKKDWFVASDIASVLMKMERTEEAIDYLNTAAFGFGDMEKKVKVYKALAQAHSLLGAKELALEYYELVALVRSDFGWAADIDTTIVLLDAGITAGRFGSSLALYERLKTSVVVGKTLAVAQSTFAKSEIRIIGSVLSILPNGKSGFVKAKFGKSYFFQFKDLVGKKTVQIGNEVSFQLAAAFDPKKQVAVENAVVIM